MPAKVINPFGDENPDFHKQIGCMTGIFQIFDRHHLIAGRRLTAQKHKKLPSGYGYSNSKSRGADHSTSPQVNLDKSFCKSLNENPRSSMESSTASLSSSSWSSFSSLDCNKSSQQEFPSFDRTFFSERTSKGSQKLKSSEVTTKSISTNPSVSVKSGRQSHGIRDVVKDSINRDSRGLSVKTSAKEEVKRHELKHKDSPRPLLLSKSLDGTYVIGIDRTTKFSVDVDESIGVLKKLKEVPHKFSEYEAKDASYTIPRECQRFSCDGREISRVSMDSRDYSKSNTSPRELPRLSLDSREGFLRSGSYNSSPKLNLLCKDLDRNSSNQRVSTVLNQDSPGHKRSTSLIAKLMGLEILPSVDLEAHEPIAEHKNIFLTKSSDTVSRCKFDHPSQSPKNTCKNVHAPQPKGHALVSKPKSSSRILTEAAPWRQQDGSDTKRSTCDYQEVQMKPKTTSVYSEIEKKLKDLDFQESNKDLRALKHILDAMHAKGLLQTKRDDDQQSEMSLRETLTRDDQNLREVNLQKSLGQGNGNPRAFDPPIVIMKPAKSVSKSSFANAAVTPIADLTGLRKLRISDSEGKRNVSLNSRSVKEHSPKFSPKSPSSDALSRSKQFNGRKLQVLSKPQQSLRDNSDKSSETSSSTSPRLQRKVECERNSRPPIPSNGSNKGQRHSINRQPSESGSPRGRQGRKASQIQSCVKRNSSRQEDGISENSDSSITLASQADVMKSSFIQQGMQSLASRMADSAPLFLNQEKSSLMLNGDSSVKELRTVAPEQPSPVSVLDASFYHDDPSRSPLKRISNSFKDDEIHSSDECWNPISLPDTPTSKISTEVGQMNPEHMEVLVQKLRELSSLEEELPTTDIVTSFSSTQNKDHLYVYEILSSSGLLLKDLCPRAICQMPVQLKSSGYAVNSDLFLVLEQTKLQQLSTSESAHGITLQPQPDPEKLHRKLVFDVVNEIIFQKMESSSSIHQLESFLRSKKLSGQQLLKDICAEIDHLQAETSIPTTCNDDDSLISGEDILHQMKGWENFRSEVRGMVLDIERSIFKDLIDEVISGEVESSQIKRSKLRRQLFPRHS
ncbi:protein LONGIFOLIA 1-like [Typha angustifolia]|uniref:protein LONGIFOLIA 1-like n=1 Tax=Typha angustifolia TaxID=59011 RepID=UPI003C2D8A2A